jgi:SAM-dependent methyltransferase
MKPTERIHAGYVHKRRVRVLSGHLAGLMPPNARILDVGCGDGLLSRLIADARADVEVTGVDVLGRDEAWIPVQQFDGRTVPFGDGTFDVVMFVDVLHHTDDASQLLREAIRVTCGSVLIKDHTLDGWLAEPTLRFMDRVGNERYGVSLPYNYWPRDRWLKTFGELGLQVDVWKSNLGLYPAPASWFFDRSLHFICCLRRMKQASAACIDR